MKINKIIFGATAMLTMGMLASCSNDEPAPGNGNEQGGATRYMAVRIQSVPDLGSRAAGEGFEEAEEGSKESSVAAADVRFFFFDKDGNPYAVNTIVSNGNTATSNMVTPTSVDPTETDGKPTAGLQGVLVLHIPEGKVATPPAKVVCVANMDEADGYANMSLSTLMTQTQNTPAITSQSKFAMTSSTYYNGGVINYTDITGKLATTAEAAQANPAEIYLERLAVKIRPVQETTFGQTYNVMRSDNGTLTEDDFVFDQNGETINLQVTLTGWAPYKTADKAYSLKSIDAAWATNAPFPAWNQPDLHRCYWATVPALELQNTSYNLANASGFTTGTYYTYENTSNTPTKMVVRGIVHKKDDATKTGIDFVKWGGYFYTTDKFLEMVAAQANTTTDKVELVADNADANTWKVEVDGEPSTTYTGIYWWKNGVTSYVFDITHIDESSAIVRNHIYQYKFDNVIGLGIPGNNPVTPTETDTYLAAKIYVLNWRLVPHTITLN